MTRGGVSQTYTLGTGNRLASWGVSGENSDAWGQNSDAWGQVSLSNK